MASEDYKESEMSKIVKRLMDEEGFEFGEAVKEAMEQTKNFESKADGGSIGIEVLFTDKMKDGGRAGFFMGGPALEGQALSIYNSMKAYGETDQAIADRLQSLGYYDPNASTPDPTPDSGQSGSQSGGRGSDQDVGYVDRQDYSFNKKNYGPGKQLEINPAAFGMSFPDQPKGPKQEGIIGLYRGLYISYIKCFPTLAIQFWTYETLKENL